MIREIQNAFLFEDEEDWTPGRGVPAASCPEMQSDTRIKQSHG